jgi:hypothetical protein
VTRIMDTAKITAGGYDLYEASEIEQRAYLVWQYAIGDSAKTEASADRGILYRGNLKTVILALWPELAPKDRHDEYQAFSRDVYGFLRSTGNAKCVQGSSDPSKVVWWLSSTWQKPVAGVVIKIPSGAAARHVELTARERRLTKKEAGEDREPAPVTIIRTKEEPVEEMVVPIPTPTKSKLQEMIEKRAEEHKQMLELIILEMRQMDQPITSEELAYLIGVHQSTARAALTELVEKGSMFSRVETVEERATRYGGKQRSRRALLFSAKDPVPTRTVRTAVKGVTMSYTPTSFNGQRGVNDAKVRAALNGTFKRQIDLVRAAQVPHGSIAGILARLVEKGEAERKMRRDETGRTVPMYRRPKGRSTTKVSTPEVVATATPSGEIAVPPVAVSGTPSSLVDQISQLVQAYVVEGPEKLAEVVAERDALKTKNAALEARVSELEAALAPLLAMLNRS